MALKEIKDLLVEEQHFEERGFQPTIPKLWLQTHTEVGMTLKMCIDSDTGVIIIGTEPQLKLLMTLLAGSNGKSPAAAAPSKSGSSVKSPKG